MPRVPGRHIRHVSGGKPKSAPPSTISPPDVEECHVFLLAERIRKDPSTMKQTLHCVDVDGHDVILSGCFPTAYFITPEGNFAFTVRYDMATSDGTLITGGTPDARICMPNPPNGPPGWCVDVVDWAKTILRFTR